MFVFDMLLFYMYVVHTYVPTIKPLQIFRLMCAHVNAEPT